MRLRKPIIIIICLFLLFYFTTCGIDTFFFLPPVDQDGQIIMTWTESAEIILPSVPYYYVTNFSIFYRIYLSNYEASGRVENTQDRQNVGYQLESDFNYFNSTFIAPSNASPPTPTSFTNRNYYLLSTDGKILETSEGASSKKIEIVFPMERGAPAYIRDTGNNQNYIMYRESQSGFSLKPEDSRFFYSDDLRIYDESTGPNRTHNRDVTASTTASYSTIYVSMYIVTSGTQDNFQPLFSKPAHIGVFRIK